MTIYDYNRLSWAKSTLQSTLYVIRLQVVILIFDLGDYTTVYNCRVADDYLKLNFYCFFIAIVIFSKKKCF